MIIIIDLNIKTREYKSREIGAEIGFDQLPSTEGDLPISAINSKLQWRLGQLLNTTASIRLNTEIGLSYYRTNSFMRQYYEAFYNSPWFLDIRIPLNLKIYYEDITQTQSLRRFGINTSFTYYNNNNTRLSGNLKTEFIKSTDIDEAEERSINFFFYKAQYRKSSLSKKRILFEY